MCVYVTGQGGRHPWPAKVVLVATHADKVECTKNAKGELLNNDADILVANVKEKFVPYFDISERVFVMDTHLAMSPDMKALRSHLGDLKSQIVKVSQRYNLLHASQSHVCGCIYVYLCKRFKPHITV